MGANDAAPVGASVWGEAGISLPEDLRGEFADAMTGEKRRLEGRLQVAALLARFPVALLVKT
jgi:maltooligosyltrehalose synthase